MGRYLVHDGREPAEVGLVVLHTGARRPDAGGEYLEAGVAGLDELGYLPDGVGAGAAGKDGVVGVVGVGVALPAFGGFAEGVVQVVAGYLVGEVEHGGGAAVDGGLGDGLRAGAFGLAGAADVGVGLDAAGHDYLAGRVDDARALGVQHSVLSHRRDALAFDCHVPVADSTRCDHCAAGDDNVHHWNLLLFVSLGIGRYRSYSSSAVLYASRPGWHGKPLAVTPRQ